MGHLRDWIAARHHQPSCHPSDAQPYSVQSPCAPQPLVYSTPYGSMGGGCQPCRPFSPSPEITPVPPLPAISISETRSEPGTGKPTPFREDKQVRFDKGEGDELPPLPPLPGSPRPQKGTLPGLTVHGDVYKYDGGRPLDGADRRPAAKPEVPGDAQSAERIRQLERELRRARDENDNFKKQMEQLRADQLALQAKFAQLQQQALRPTVQPPGTPAPFTPPPVAQPGQLRPSVPSHVPPPVEQRPVAPAPKITPPGQLGLKPPAAVPSDSNIGPPPGEPQAQPRKDVKEPPKAAPPLREVSDLVGDVKQTYAAQRQSKIADAQVPVDLFMSGERERLTRAMDNNYKDHPETTSAKTSWLLTQGNENLIKDSGYRQKVKDVPLYLHDSSVINDENAVRDERVKQWEQIRSNATNKDDPNMEKKQGILTEIMNGQHVYEGATFGRMNAERGDNPLRNNKLQWQVEAAEALVRVNGAPGIDHDYATRSIIRGLVGDPAGNYVNLKVPEAARVKLLDAIIPMSKDEANPFLKPKPKDTAFAIVVTALERSHASRQPEEAFQTAAINKLTELNDPRAYFVLQKLATESPSNKIKELATKHAEDLRKKIAP